MKEKSWRTWHLAMASECNENEPNAHEVCAQNRALQMTLEDAGIAYEKLKHFLGYDIHKFRLKWDPKRRHTIDFSFEMFIECTGAIIID
jgi:hypothetical protein